MFYYHWLIKKLHQPIALQSKVRQEIQTDIERVGRVREMSCSCQRRQMPEPTAKPQSQGDTQINRNGLI
ncbi:hypothetical protein ACRRTK_019913 [Alexandromys fortis]